MEQIKVMVTVDSEDILWNIVSESVISCNHPAYILLSKQIDLKQWKRDYLNLYNNWLYNDDNRIYNIDDPINKSMILALAAVNKLNKNVKLFYWFDVDREEHPEYRWTKCPLSNEPLITLPSYIHKNNRYVSTATPLIFPSNE
ncbi:hypothetical protein [Mucilaginibacter polytrichastri]|uniref:hypothetical protein n=1 Tax=Mucilaginibacter polytrichastri TaxID=1302689 RepID=UPI0008E441F6|nr:hypothetical protein [Mucilaginibacter polytrichastri]SFS47950.1 hypothetical protein SAMN04487890_101736 [Mucilaginibacter polytrichastri]